jgi:hypothetical protein
MSYQNIKYKNQKVLVPLEDSECVTFVNFLRLKKLPHFHITNENVFSVTTRKKLKAQGLESGVPDYCVFLPHKIVFVEMKRRKKSLSKVSDNQKKWIDTIDCYEYANATVCYGATEAIEYIKEELS